jgi:AbrB family looped-hinge helix DNA binding protein
MIEMHEGKYIFGTAKVGEKGQIVIPKEARDIFEISPGDTVLILGDRRKGLAIVKSSVLKEFALQTLELFNTDTDESEKSM